MRAHRSLALLALALPACTAGEGEVVITTYGEAFVEDGIPASALDDGWAIAFDRFAVTVREAAIGGRALAPAAPVDLAVASAGRGHRLGALVVEAGTHADARFTLARLEVSGAASRGPETRRFAWVFDDETRYSACETVTGVEAGGEATFQITVHADHLFADSLVAASPRLLFQPLADADADGDGEVTATELGARGLGAYDPGSEGGIEDLWRWLEAQARAVGHADGEAHCRAAPAP
jgi:hypothetical protein